MLRGALSSAVGLAAALVALATSAQLEAAPRAWGAKGDAAPLGLPKKKPSMFLEVPDRDEVLGSAAYRYANMSNEDAIAELDRRGVKYHRVDPVGTVRAPIRLDGDLHGVEFHSSLPAEQRATSMFEILDARLALALDDFAVILARHDVVEVVHYTMYRPNVAPPGAKPAAADDKAEPGKKGKPGKARPDAKPDAADAAIARKGDDKREGPKAKRRASIDDKAQTGGKSARRATSPHEQRKKSGWDKAPAVDEPADLHDLHDPTGCGLSLEPMPERAKGAPPKAVKPGKPGPERGRGKNAKKRILPQEAEISHAKWAPPGTRHPAGLAIDVGILKKSDGAVLNVAQHFHGKIGDKTCGPDVPDADTPEARELRAIVCEAREAEVFTYTLTPNFNADHFDHFHMEIKPGVEWFLYH